MGQRIGAIGGLGVFGGLEQLTATVSESVQPRDVEMRHSDGRWFALHFDPHCTAGNSPEGVIISFSNIDELKRSHEGILDYVNSIMATVRSPVLVLKPDLSVNSANEAFYKLFQVPAAETEGRLIYELGNGQWDNPELRRQLERILSEGVAVNDVEITRVFPGIGRRIMLLNGRRLEQKAGVAPLIFLSIEDITERKDTEQSTHWLAAIVESSVDAIIGKNLDGRIISCNQAAVRLFGYRPEELIGQSIMMLIPPDHQNEEAHIIERIKRGERIEHFETIRRAKDGRLIEISLTISPVKDTSGKIVGASKIARDITERRRVQLKLDESLQREKEARQQAEMANRAKDDFLAILSHELRTPLNPVLLVASEATENAALPAEVRAQFGVVRDNVELEARLIDDLLDVTSITHGKMSLRTEVVNVHTVMEEAIQTVQADIKRKGLTLSVNLAAGQPIMRADAVRLKQAFWNVLRNAIKFTPEHGRISVNSVVTAERVIFRITDTGIGLAADELERIFQPFAQGNHLETEERRFGGLGLGLNISHRLIEMHAGGITARSPGLGRGSTFIIELPLTRQAATEATWSPAAPDARARAKIPTAGVRILLVDDHEATRHALSQLLARRGCRVVLASSVAEALELAGPQKFDVVISDIGLPDRSGHELMSQLSSRFGLKGIALTGYGMQEDVQRSLASGFVAHLTKPVRTQDLEKALQLALQSD